MKKEFIEMLERCKACKPGMCCRDGVEVTKEEMKKIEAFGPKIKKPWFEPIEPDEISDSDHVDTTVIRGGTCVFQAKNKLCVVYEVRPNYCAEFPLESGEIAEHYEELCLERHNS